MYIYYNKDNQIEAVYSGEPTTKVWEDLGYELTEVPDEWNPTRDKAVVLDGKEIVELVDSPRPPTSEEIAEKEKEEKLKEEKDKALVLEGLSYADLSSKERDALLEHAYLILGLLDENGNVVIKKPLI